MRKFARVTVKVIDSSAMRRSCHPDWAARLKKARVACPGPGARLLPCDLDDERRDGVRDGRRGYVARCIPGRLMWRERSMVREGTWLRRPSDVAERDVVGPAGRDRPDCGSVAYRESTTAGE